MSLKYKLFVILLVLSIIPIILVSYSSQYFMFRSSTEYSASISSQYVQFVSRDISNYLQSLSESFDSLFTNSVFQRFLDIPDRNLADQANHIIQFRSILQYPLQFQNEIVGVLYLDKAGKVYFESYQKDLNHGYSFRTDPIYGSVYSMKTKELLVPHSMDYVDRFPERVFTFVRPVINLRNGDIHAWFLIEIREEKILEMLSDPQHGQEGRLILYHMDTNSVVSNVETEQSIIRQLKLELEKKPENQGQFLFTAESERYEATYANLSFGNWKLVWIAPLHSIYKGVEQSIRLTLWIAVASLSISLFIAFPVMRIMLKPLNKLVLSMRKLGRGTYVPVNVRSSRDEIGYVIKSYNEMLEQLKKLEQEVYLAKIREKERELLQLQAQINPHFLFNTLETIESYAVRNNGHAVGEMVQSVSRMMRYSVRDDGGWAPLSEEIDYIRDFLKIHFYRNRKEVSAYFDIAADVVDTLIMKLSIQPFVENALKYGWSPRMGDEDFHVTINAERKEGKLHVNIINSGATITDEMLGNINRLLESQGEHVDPYFRNHTGIYNVYRRFLLAYNNDVQFSFGKQDGKTVVQFVIPIRETA